MTEVTLQSAPSLDTLIEKSQELCNLFAEVKALANSMDKDIEFNCDYGENEVNITEWNSSACYGEDEITTVSAESVWHSSNC